MKKIRTGMMTLAAMAVLGTNMATAAPLQGKELSVLVNGNKIEQMAIQNQQTVLVPLRTVAESLGFQVAWNPQTKAAEVKKGEISGQVALDQDQNTLYNGTTYVPVAFVENVLQAEVNVTEDTVKVEEEKEAAPPVTGNVTKVMKNEKGNYSILLNGYETGIILHLNEDTKITSADGKELKPEDLKMGMEVEATHAKFMAMSMPPQTGVFTIVVKSSLESSDVLGTGGRLVSVEKGQDGSYRVNVEGEALSEGSQEHVVLTITEETVIVNARDQKAMKPEDLKPEMRVYAFYGPKLTRSLPPQGVAEKLVVEIPAEN
ncbi:copper amine oxidase N-terminal domain-containing protein [Brevibacillus panacihumi]|uniref:Copper amine oxidase N-terminal domain-containing protein n=1 Tax=Brevibacillus panacihumi TaxID=497735 RepID=A0A3M8D872_9BACL|nr:copper amine oxidase N-terminal domain-containing protein [Brevibacillus panacihumi]RNB83465.1 copper amine oxidase N-terminal domain-containing protein [Brevibacillus panacihumi]